MVNLHYDKIKKYSGERLETFIESEVAVEHLHRYALALSLSKDKKVLDIASGEGYGSNLMADIALEVTGVDIAPEVVANANKKYGKHNLKFLEGSAAAIPLQDHYFDVVVSFETIEHHNKHQEMLTEIKRVMKPGGILIISSPDKLYYTDKRNFHNVFHVKELYKEEFKKLMNGFFKNTSFYNQRATFASFLIPEQGIGSHTQYTGNYNRIIQSDEFAQMYIVCIASDAALPPVGLSFFRDDDLMGRLHAQTVKKVEQTWSYLIGHYTLLPFKALLKLFSK